MNETHTAVSIFIVLLLVASAVAMATKWIRVPYTLALVIVGLVISPMHFLPSVHISPELILLIFLPALLFEAAWNLNLRHLRENLVPILTLAVAGVCLSAGVVAGVLRWAGGLSWSSALLFGAMISATDPVSVLALLKHYGLPKRLATIVEGESLFNDGTAVVVFRILAGLAVGSASHGLGSLALESLREFGLVVIGGVAVGAIVGLLGSKLTSYFDDHLLEITLTTIAAYGSFLLAEGLGVSPVIAVLVAGLIIGNYGRRTGMSATTQVAVNAFWEYAAFVVNSLVFLLIGLEIQMPVLLQNASAIGWAVLAVLVARPIVVYGLIPLCNLAGPKVPTRWQHVLVWGGLRGSLSVALVLSLPTSIPGRSQLVAMIFGSVIFSLLVQGLSMARFLRALGFAQVPTSLREFELLLGQLLSGAAAMRELDRLKAQGMLTEDTYQLYRETSSRDYQEAHRQLTELKASDPSLQRRQEGRIRRHLIDTRRTRLSELLREGIISEATYRSLNRELDEAAAAWVED
ncbi:MAG: Na+/H+ antiporter [Bryobacteraceae bacterium]|jgi:CPA1 family monovalent cation:H+ antiporter